MDKSTGFNYTYSATVNKEIQEIVKKYIPKKESKFEELKRLDYKVQTSGLIQALAIGIVGFLVFGIGVCMSICVIGGGIILGAFLGITGFVGMLLAYPVNRLIFKKTKERLMPRILDLTSELIGDN